VPYTPDMNPTRISKELQTKIENAPSMEHIAEYLRQAAVEQNLAQADPYNPEILTPTARAETPQPQRFGKTVVVNGTKHVLDADSESELAQKEIEVYRSLMQPTTARTEVAREENAGRFISTADQSKADENAFQRSEAELAFRRGELSVNDYLEKSGAIAGYFERQGIPLEELKATVQEKQTQRYEQSWQDATKEFLNSPEGRTWPGGQENLQRIGELIQQMGHGNAQDKVAALVQAYSVMKEKNLVAPNPELVAKQREEERLKKIAEARSPEELRMLLEVRSEDERRLAGGSSIFGR
jgi:hypothetical protein